MSVIDSLASRRWNGSTAGRLEVWYDTFTDPATGAGFWLHHELVSPSDGRAAFVHGWAAAFPSLGAGVTPVWERFGPLPVDDAGPFFSCGDVVCEPGVRRGATSRFAWDLRDVDAPGSPPLFTFPRWSWEREVLPGSQIVPSPHASFSGSFACDDRTWTLVDAPGAAARIYGHGNAQRWAWLHADLGDGDVLEIVAAVSRRPLLDRLPPLPMVQLRVGGVDRPSNPLRAGLVALRAHVALPSWSVRGHVAGSPFRVDVTLPPERCVVIPYTDPDGAGATCTNSERADAVVTWGSRTWRLDGTAHAEVGLRP
jgi:hypothetical protein